MVSHDESSVVPMRTATKAGGVTRCWMSLRHSCCRFGWYPVLVAPLLTAACVLSLYSSSGCDFVRVNVGFTPQPNIGWNESEAMLGFWYYEQEGAEHDYDFLVPNNLLGECESYTDGFEEAFIEKDRTWKVSRIMAIVAGLSSGLAAIIAWLFCLTPLPPGFLWPAIFLPLVMVAFISEGSKFLVLDIGVCRTNVWLPSGVNSLPQTAESCELGESAIYSIAAGAFLLCALLLVCLRVPHERELDPHFGMAEPDDKDEAEDTDDHNEDEEDPYRTYYADGHIGQTTSSPQGQVSDFDTGEDELVISHDLDAALAGGIENKDSEGNDNEEDTEVPSESRSTTLANMEASQAQDTGIGNQLLEKLVDDLNCSYQSTTNSKEEAKAEEPKAEEPKGE